MPKLEIKPDVIIFFDGYNELNGIRYNGKYDDDSLVKIAELLGLLKKNLCA